MPKREVIVEGKKYDSVRAAHTALGVSRGCFMYRLRSGNWDYKYLYNHRSLPKEGFWVYYLPEEHYVGLTRNIYPRISIHKSSGKNVNGWRTLFHSDNEKEAERVEAEFHITLGCFGARWADNK